MKKKLIRIEFLEIGLMTLIILLIAIVFWMFSTTEKTSNNDNVELNNIEQYHLSEGRKVKFVEDIFLN